MTGGFEGGGTEFPHATFKPKPGYSLIFPSNWCYPHSGQKVTKGWKRVAVTWYYVDRELIVTKDESVKGWQNNQYIVSYYKSEYLNGYWGNGTGYYSWCL